MVLKVYKLDGSPPARAVMMTIEALGILDVEYEDMDLFAKDHLSEEFLKMNPQHTIPTIKDGDFTIWDSHAITAYLVGQYASDDALYPKEPKKRALVDQRLHFDSGILFPTLRAAVAPIFFKGAKSFDPEIIASIKAAYDFTEAFLTSPWLAGDSITLADICCVASISSLGVIVPFDENTYPKITAWVQRCATKDYYKKRNQPGLDIFKHLLLSRIE